MNNKWLIGALLLSLLPQALAPAQDNSDVKAELLSVQKIWDEAPHNAFTDLIRFNDQWLCVFREGQGHVSPDGSIRVITSEDGQKWTSAAHLTSDKGDLRDAKISITPDGRLLLAAARAEPLEGKAKRHQSMVWFSDDARDWGEPIDIGPEDYWLWRVTWHDGVAWSVGYSTGQRKTITLFRSEDGRQFKPHAQDLFTEGYPNEHSMLFLEDDTSLLLLRRDGKDANSAQLGIASPPYKQWQWKDLAIRIGGPDIIRLDDGRILVAGRSYEPHAQTRLWWLDPDKAQLTEILTLPSAGDTSYPGLVLHEGVLWISYYSSHEGKTSIYLAKVRLP